MWKEFKDNFVNFSAQLGLGAGSQQDGSHYRQSYKSRNRWELESAYRTNWVAGVAIDTVAEDMTRAGSTITSAIDPDRAGAIHRGFEKWEIWNQLRQAVKWSRLYGGAIAVMMVDGQDLSTPLNVESIKRGQFKGIQVLDRWMIQPSLNDLVEDYGPHFGLPQYYDVVADSMALRRASIHHTRCIRLEGVHLPYWQRLAENLWGQSVLERIWDRMVAFDSTTQGAAQLVYKAHLRTLKVPGFREIVAGGGPAYDGLVKQIEMMRATQSSEGITILDGEDEFETSSYAFSGLSDMMLQFGQQLSGALQVPMVRLFGQSPAGLSSTGESDLRTYFDGVNAAQNSRLRTPLHLLYEMISRSETGQPLDDDFEFAFNSLWQLDDNEKATIAQSVGTVMNDLEREGNISHARVLEELRNLSSKIGVFSTITDQDIEDAENEAPEPELAAVPEPAVEGNSALEETAEEGSDGDV